MGPSSVNRIWQQIEVKEQKQQHSFRHGRQRVRIFAGNEQPCTSILGLRVFFRGFLPPVAPFQEIPTCPSLSRSFLPLFGALFWVRLKWTGDTETRFSLAFRHADKDQTYRVVVVVSPPDRLDISWWWWFSLVGYLLLEFRCYVKLDRSIDDLACLPLPLSRPLPQLEFCYVHSARIIDSHVTCGEKGIITFLSIAKQFLTKIKVSYLTWWTIINYVTTVSDWAKIPMSVVEVGVEDKMRQCWGLVRILPKRYINCYK